MLFKCNYFFIFLLDLDAAQSIIFDGLHSISNNIKYCRNPVNLSKKKKTFSKLQGLYIVSRMGI